HGYMLFYHEATVRDGGLDPAKPPATLTDWLNWSTQLTRGDIHGASYSTNWWTFHHFLRQAGADIFSPDGQKAGFNNGAGVAAMTALSDLWQRNNHPLPVGALDLLEQRRLATLLNGPWNLNRLGQPSSPAFNDLRVAFAPQMNPAKPAWWAQSHQLALPKQQQVDEAKRTAAFNFVLWLTEHTLDWSQAGQLPANRKVLTSDGFQRSNHPVHQHLKVWERHLSSAAFMTLHPKYVDIESTLGPVLNRGMMRELSPQAALVDLEQAVNALLAQ
ncbi:MAG TPA: extracellular solute-binding protein, partial [Chloroflexota bacterium]|nr:extracellular solute-binding protein [Chloroflexota bacterium]